ncbi:MAG: murein biosynthesis integral membrane protein MurJ, partial [Streptosporangiaceae bacterium]
MAGSRLGSPHWQRLVRGMTRGLTRGIAGAAALIAVVTVVSRAAGFGRYLVFAHTVGGTCLGTAYFTANMIPNIVFDIVVGGALSSMVVPVLAGPAARRDTDHVRQVSSALLTWSCLLLVPLVVAGVFVAEPLVRLFAQSPLGCAGAQVVAVASRMLIVFLPQLVLYGVAAVAYGVLQAHRRFLAPAAAPLANSLVVSAAYIAFVPFGGGRQDSLGRLPFDAELILSIGTTLGVAALALTAAIPLARLRLRLRPNLSFPPGVAGRVRRLAAAGVAALVAQQLATAVVIALANGYGGRGTLPLYNYAWALYLVPYAVLAVPIATSAFPTLSARASAGDAPGFAKTAAATTRAVLLVSLA